MHSTMHRTFQSQFISIWTNTWTSLTCFISDEALVNQLKDQMYLLSPVSKLSLIFFFLNDITFIYCSSDANTISVWLFCFLFVWGYTAHHGNLCQIYRYTNYACHTLLPATCCKYLFQFLYLWNKQKATNCLKVRLSCAIGLLMCRHNTDSSFESVDAFFVFKWSMGQC